MISELAGFGKTQSCPGREDDGLKVSHRFAVLRNNMDVGGLVSMHKQTTIFFPICKEAEQLHRCFRQLKKHLGLVVGFVSEVFGPALIVLDVIARSRSSPSHQK